MSEPAAPSRYRLSMAIAQQDGIRTYIALDTMAGDSVLGHVLMDSSPDARVSMTARLAQLSGTDAGQIIATTVTERGWTVITRAEDGLNMFADWLDARTAVPAAAPLPPGIPPMPMPTAAMPMPPAASGNGPLPEPFVLPTTLSAAPPPPAAVATPAVSPPAPAPPGEFTQMFRPLPPAPPGSVAPAPALSLIAPPVVSRAAESIPVAMPMPMPMPEPVAVKQDTPLDRSSTPVPESRTRPALAMPEPARPPLAVPLPAGPPPAPAVPVQAQPRQPAPGEFTAMFSPGAHLSSPSLQPPAPLAPPPASPPVYAAPSVPPPSDRPPSAPPASAPPAYTPPAPPPFATPAYAPPAFAPPPEPRQPSFGAGVSALSPLPPAPLRSAPLLPAASPPPLLGAALTPPPAAVPAAPSTVPPVLPPPLFGLPETSGPGAVKAPARAAASEYTLVMQAQVKPVDAPTVSTESPAKVDESTGARRLTMPVILMINAVVLLTIALILYFVLRRPPDAVPVAPGTTMSADSAAAGRNDSTASGAGGEATTP